MASKTNETIRLIKGGVVARGAERWGLLAGCQGDWNLTSSTSLVTQLERSVNLSDRVGELRRNLSDRPQAHGMAENKEQSN